MKGLLIKNASVVSPEKILKNHNVLCRGGEIIEIASSLDLSSETAEVINASGNYLVPGFIDLHLHGLHEYLIDNGPDDLAQICALLSQYGVTSFLPSVCPLPKGEDADFLKSLVSGKYNGADILGFHLEGPFLTLAGALPPEAIGTADEERVALLIEAAKPYQAIFSIAPDFERIEEFIPLMAHNNTPVFITHTKATVKQTRNAIDAGACHATHFYDVFPAPPETDPGVRPCGAVEAILAEAKVSVDFILDGEHVDPVAVQMALECKGPDRVCLITDSNIGAGLPPGRYKFGKEEVEFRYASGPARMTENARLPGSLAGSGLTMDKALGNAVKMLGVNLTQAVKMVSTNPAKVLGINDKKGQIKRGFDADLVLMNKDYNILQTWINGKSSYKKQEEQKEK